MAVNEDLILYRVLCWFICATLRVDTDNIAGSRIGRQPNSVKHATMLELQYIKHNKDGKMEIKVEPVDPLDSPTNSGPDSPEGGAVHMTSAYDTMAQPPQESSGHMAAPRRDASSHQPLLPSAPIEISHEVHTPAQHVTFHTETVPYMNSSIAQMQNMSSSLGHQGPLNIQDQVMRPPLPVASLHQHEHGIPPPLPHPHPHSQQVEFGIMNQLDHEPRLQQPSQTQLRQYEPPAPQQQLVQCPQDSGVPLPVSGQQGLQHPAETGLPSISTSSSMAPSVIASRLLSTSSLESSTSVPNTPSIPDTPGGQSESSPSLQTLPGPATEGTSSGGGTTTQKQESSSSAGKPLEELDEIIAALDTAKKELRIMKRRVSAGVVVHHPSLLKTPILDYTLQVKT